MNDEQEPAPWGGLITEAMRVLGRKRIASMNKEQLHAFQSASASRGWAGMSATERQIEMKRRMAKSVALRKQKRESSK